MRVQHFDRMTIRFDAASLVVNADQSRTIDGVGAHTGPYTYHDDEGQPFVEHVPASTLFDQASLDSAAGSTLTIRHGPGLVTPDRYHAEAHGSWVKAWDAGGGNLGVRVRVASREGLAFVADAIKRSQSVELSPVYNVDVVERVGSDGKPVLVQEGRLYSALAMLGPDEARGGSTAKLKLDGPECAPKGCRLEVPTPRLDSAPRVPLHSDTKSRNVMKKVTISSGGKSCQITQSHLDGLVRMRLDANADQVETTEVTWQSGDEEPGLMVIPTMMWEGMLEGIGATSAPAAEVETVEAEIEQVEALDADDPEKLDSKAVKKMIADAIATDKKRTRKSDARISAVHSDARTILPPEYDFTVPWTQVCVDAIAKAAPELEARARKLAKDAATDPESAGMLRQMLAERRKDSATPSVPLVVNADAGDGAKPWESPTMPKRSKQ